MSSDEDLFKCSCQGDEKAFEILYLRYFNKLVWFAGGFVKDQDTAKDLVQDVFMKLIHRPELFNANMRFSTWIYNVTGNQCKNRLRNEENRLRILRENNPNERSEEQEHTIDRKTLRRDLQSAIAQLSDKEKRIYVLRFEEEMSIKQISDITGSPEGTVKSGIFHLLKKISKQLKHYSHAE